MARPALLPLQQLIDRHQGLPEDGQVYAPPVPYTEKFTVELFVSGKPKAKDRGTPRTGKQGQAYIFTSPETKAREAYIREEFLSTMSTIYPQFVQYLPIVSGWCWLELYFLLPPPESHYSGKPHVAAPDTDNLYKLVKDALSGRASGRPPLAFKDDSMSAGCYPVWKGYWDPSLIDVPGYPGSPGTHVVIHYELTPRDPKLGAVGEFVCGKCGSDLFTGERSRSAHERKCKG